MLYALSHVDIVPQLGAAWFIPTVLVPVLLIAHFMIFRRLLDRAANLQETVAI